MSYGDSSDNGDDSNDPTKDKSKKNQQGQTGTLGQSPNMAANAAKLASAMSPTYAGPKGTFGLNQGAYHAAANAAGYGNLPNMNATPGDLDSVARMMVAESGPIKNPAGLPQAPAMQGVADVIRNRAISGAFPSTLQGVMTQRKQFSPSQSSLAAVNTNSVPYQTARTIAGSVMDGTQPPVVGNATYYGNLDTINNKPGYSSNASQKAFASIQPTATFSDVKNPRTFSHTFGNINGSGANLNTGVANPSYVTAADVPSIPQAVRPSISTARPFAPSSGVGMPQQAMGGYTPPTPPQIARPVQSQVAASVTPQVNGFMAPAMAPQVARPAPSVVAQNSGFQGPVNPVSPRLGPQDSSVVAMNDVPVPHAPTQMQTQNPIRPAPGASATEGAFAGAPPQLQNTALNDYRVTPMVDNPVSGVPSMVQTVSPQPDLQDNPVIALNDTQTPYTSKVQTQDPTTNRGLLGIKGAIADAGIKKNGIFGLHDPNARGLLGIRGAVNDATGGVLQNGLLGIKGKIASAGKPAGQTKLGAIAASLPVSGPFIKATTALDKMARQANAQPANIYSSSLYTPSEKTAKDKNDGTTLSNSKDSDRKRRMMMLAMAMNGPLGTSTANALPTNNYLA